MFTVEKIVVNISAIQWANFGKLGRKNPFQYRSLFFLSRLCVRARRSFTHQINCGIKVWSDWWSSSHWLVHVIHTLRSRKLHVIEYRTATYIGLIITLKNCSVIQMIVWNIRHKQQTSRHTYEAPPWPFNSMEKCVPCCTPRIPTITITM